MILPDADTCHRAVSGRDARFDGWFYPAVRSTGSYCLPSCPAGTPRRADVTFYPSAAAAQRAGYRACTRCRPDAAPGSPEWDVRGDLAGRALRLIADGVIDRDGLAGLARRLGHPARQVTRTLVAEVGAGPRELATAQRARTARMLLETTDLPMPDVAFGAGFASVRQFDDTVRAVFATTPTALRARRGTKQPAEQGTIVLRLPYRDPMDFGATLRYLGRRAIPHVETGEPDRFTRVIGAPHGPALVSLTEGDDAIACRVGLADQRDLVFVLSRVRRLLDLDADPLAVDAHLGQDPVLGALVAERPGLRAPGAVDGFEMAVRAIVGQQISVSGARTVLGRLAAEHGVRAFDGQDFLLFPTAARIAAIDPATLPLPKARGRTLVAVARACAAGELTLDPGADRAHERATLLALPGIGPWTADYLALRAVRDPDVLLATDLGVRRAAERLGVDLADGRPAWAPWRTYATHHLWADPH